MGLYVALIETHYLLCDRPVDSGPKHRGQCQIGVVGRSSWRRANYGKQLNTNHRNRWKLIMLPLCFAIVNTSGCLHAVRTFPVEDGVCRYCLTPTFGVL
jgi:hypothetical protein